MKNKSCSNRETFSVVRDLLVEGSQVTVRVKGQSMLPFFRSGTTVTIRPIREDDFKKYSVVFAATGGNFVIHRIISVEESGVTLLGDGNVYGTETMTKDEVYGAIDCSKIHLLFAKLWLWMRPLRRYPLAIFRRVM
jgi:hypothetical protein